MTLRRLTYPGTQHPSRQPASAGPATCSSAVAGPVPNVIIQNEAISGLFFAGFSNGRAIRFAILETWKKL
jgi:hypothetical protein